MVIFHSYVSFPGPRLVGGFNRLEKYDNMKVNGKDDIPYIIMENKVHVPNHQSVNHDLTTINHY